MFNSLGKNVNGRPLEPRRPEMPIAGVQTNTKSASVQKDLSFLHGVDPQGLCPNIGSPSDRVPLKVVIPGCWVLKVPSTLRRMKMD
jgi:hypothetical protein